MSIILSIIWLFVFIMMHSIGMQSIDIIPLAIIVAGGLAGLKE